MCAIVRLEMYFPARERFSQVRTVADMSYQLWTLQYRSEGFGAVARAHPRSGLGIECDFESTQCRKSALVPM